MPEACWKRRQRAADAPEEWEGALLPLSDGGDDPAFSDEGVWKETDRRSKETRFSARAEMRD
jgi:hypothetical protein